jgi:hypothetical protein
MPSVLAPDAVGKPDEAVLGAEVPLVDNGGQDPGRQVVDATSD